jgi:hypothetical protein
LHRATLSGLAFRKVERAGGTPAVHLPGRALDLGNHLLEWDSFIARGFCSIVSSDGFELFELFLDFAKIFNRKYDADLASLESLMKRLIFGVIKTSKSQFNIRGGRAQVIARSRSSRDLTSGVLGYAARLPRELAFWGQ